MGSFTIEMLPAKHGDALWIEYARGERVRRIMIDAGPLGAWPQVRRKLESLPDDDRRLELLVISHVDTDHIEGVIRMLAPPRAKWAVEPKDIWFNGYAHMRPQTDLGGKQGEYLSALIHQRAYGEWNKAFRHGAVVVPDDGALPRVKLRDGMTLTLLSPDAAKLEAMADQWEKDIAGWGTDPGDLDAAWERLDGAGRYHPGEELTLGPEDLSAKLRAQLEGHDGSAANGSSIAFLAEFDGRSCLFLADAHDDLVCASIERLIPEGEEALQVDAVKVSHHGSRNNITARFMALVDAEHFLFSTNGDQHGHPDKEAVEAVIVGARRTPTLWFNHRNGFTQGYGKRPGAGERFHLRYPEPGEDGIVVPL